MCPVTAPARSRRPGADGVSFLEVLVATAIMALALLPVLNVFFSAGEGLKQTLPYQQAVFLSEKAIEEMRLAATEDPYFLDRLVDDRLGASRGPVVRGGHPLFEVLEDSRPPWGRIRPRVDLAIAPEAGPLFAQVEPLGVAVLTTVGPAPQAGLSEARIQLAFDWLDRRGRDMRYVHVTAVRAWTPLARVEPPIATPTDAALGEAIAPGAGLGLSALVAERAAARAKLEALARLLLLGRDAADLLFRYDPPLAALAAEARRAAAPARARILMRMSRILELVATTLLGHLQAMEPAVGELARGLPPGSLGRPAPPDELRERSIGLVGAALDRFFDHLRGALVASTDLAGLPRLNAGTRIAAYERALRCMAMEALAAPWPATTPIRDLAAGLESYYEDRCPHLSHRFGVERRRADTLSATYPLGEAAGDVRTLRESLAQAALAVYLYVEERPL